MEDIKPFLLLPTATLREALQLLEDQRIKIIFVVKKNGKLMGACSDGDIRRTLLKGGDLDTTLVSKSMNPDPVMGRVGEKREALMAMMRRHGVSQLPVVDDEGFAKSILLLNDPRRRHMDTVPVILMVGGLGKRLRPLTEDCPKPLLPVGGIPLLERIINRFREQGFRDFYLSINYLGHMIEQHFGNGDRLDVSISYLREDKKLGTGGALSLLPKDLTGPMIVMNGDLLTEFDFRELVEQHRRQANAATMCVRQYRTSVPFGVVEFEQDIYQETVEKPTLVHYINSGIYCLSDVALSYVPENSFYDMPTLFEDITNAGGVCGVFKTKALWYDVGSHDEYERVQRIFSTPED